MAMNKPETSTIFLVGIPAILALSAVGLLFFSSPEKIDDPNNGLKSAPNIQRDEEQMFLPTSILTPDNMKDCIMIGEQTPNLFRASIKLEVTGEYDELTVNGKPHPNVDLVYPGDLVCRKSTATPPPSKPTESSFHPTKGKAHPLSYSGLRKF